MAEPQRHLLGKLSSFPLHLPRMVRAGDVRMLVIRTEDGAVALDNACPHQGYGLTQGLLDHERGVLTCTWHRWQFRIADGRCLHGEEAVRTYDVLVEGDELFVEVPSTSPSHERERLLPSLREGIEEFREGQIARDVVRLLRAEADPIALVGEGIAFGASRAEFGWGHALCVASDAIEFLAAGELVGDDRAYPVVNALVGLAEEEQRRPLRKTPDPMTELPEDPIEALHRCVTARDPMAAEALIAGGLRHGISPTEIRTWLLESVCAHHLSTGHVAIYSQKAYSLIDHLGTECASIVLPGLAYRLVLGAPEDTLPYFRTAAAEVQALDLEGLAGTACRKSTGWSDDDQTLRQAILDPGGAAPIASAAHAVFDGAGIDGLLDVVVLTASDRLLRHDPACDRVGTEFDWLAITHVLTYADAARWAWGASPGPATARLAFWALMMAHDSGRAERVRGVVPTPPIEPRDGDLTAAITAQDEGRAAAIALASSDGGRELETIAYSDLAGSLFMSAHLIKTVHAARREAGITDSNLPLAAAARFLAARRKERYVHAATAEAIQLAQTGKAIDR